jgi:hypothetical protein
MIQPRFLLTIIVLAQLMVRPIWDLYESIDAGIVQPLLSALVGSGRVPIKAGIFDLGLVLGSILKCFISIVLLVLVLRLALFFSWRWISKLLPPALIPPQVEQPPTVEPTQPLSPPP